MREVLDQITTQIDIFQKEAAAQAEGNKAAGARARKATSELTKLFKDFRKESIEQAKK